MWSEERNGGTAMDMRRTSLRDGARWLIALVMATAAVYALEGLLSLAAFLEYEGQAIPGRVLDGMQLGSAIELLLFLSGAVAWLMWHRATSAATTRSMKGNRGKNTKPELELRRLLREAGYPGYRLHWKKAPGEVRCQSGARCPQGDPAGGCGMDRAVWECEIRQQSDAVIAQIKSALQ